MNERSTSRPRGKAPAGKQTSGGRKPGGYSPQSSRNDGFPRGGHSRPHAPGADDTPRGRADHKRPADHQRPFDEKVPRHDRPQRPASFRSHSDRPAVPPNTAVQHGGPLADEETLLIMGRNAVREAVKSGRSINKILVVPEQDGSLHEIIGLAKAARLIVQETPRRKLDELCLPYGHGNKPGNHQGILALTPGIEYASLDDILQHAAQKQEPPFLILLDGIEDPHNVGSIIRSAVCAGVHGVILPKHRSSPVTAAVIKTSAGAASHIPIAKVTNLSAAIKELKQHGIWIVGADAGGAPMQTVRMKGPAALVIGSEQSGISRLVLTLCDHTAAIPLKGAIGSLNASVAAAVLMYEKLRQDNIEAPQSGAPATL